MSCVLNVESHSWEVHQIKVKMGSKNASYHCDRHRPMFRVRLDAFDKVIGDFVKDVKFTDKFLFDLKEAIIADWQKREDE
ncbi:MAG: hypothetical protein UZ22_OP11002000529 [Microgenomates bacterium OLB23]|nr:MAG: hypothetical protein UZ22_OP11002000529 [Microgenomates bacterium OLB23]